MKGKICFLGFLCFFLSFFHPLLGKTYVAVKAEAPAIVAKHPFELEVGIPSFTHKLRIDANPDIIYEDPGAGFRAQISHLGPFFWRAGLNLGFANLSRRNSTETIDMDQVDFYFEGGFTFGRGPLRLIPYIGLGGEYASYSDPTNISLPVDFSYSYFPVGGRIQFIHPFFRIGIDMALKVMLWGKVTVEYSQANPSYTDESDDLDPSVGFRLMIPIDIILLRTRRRPLIALNLTFWYEYQILETPASNTTIIIDRMIFTNTGAFFGVKFFF